MPQSIDGFLEECRSLISERKVDLFLNDPENRATAGLLAYSPSAILEELKELKPEDLFDGPAADKNSKYPGEVFVFKKDISGHCIYIKLKIRDVRGRKDLFMMSFHPDRPPKKGSLI